MPEATPCRMASSPEWKYVPSPRLMNWCASSVKWAMPCHCAPSPPIWLKPASFRSIQVTMKWHPMPAPTRDPSGTTVEVLCGHPAQK